MSRDIEWAEVEDVKCIAETAEAVLVKLDGAQVWVPKSQISDDSEVGALGDEGTLVVAEWFAVKQEWA